MKCVFVHFSFFHNEKVESEREEERPYYIQYIKNLFDEFVDAQQIAQILLPPAA